MANITQRNRLIAIATSLGEDFLLLKTIRAREAISELYELEIELLHEESKENYKPTAIDPASILGKSVTIRIDQTKGDRRAYSGIVKHFSQGTRNNRFSFYYATIVPHVWVLTQVSQSRIFQQKSVPDVLREVLKDFEVIFEIQGTFEPRNYIVQYRETDWGFLSRLMEEEGIYYYFAHDGQVDKLIIANTPQSHRDTPNQTQFPFHVEEVSSDYALAIKTWETDNNLQTGTIELWDHNFQLPKQKLNVSQPSRFDVGINQNLEVYDFPGGYARKYDGIDKSGGENAGDLQKIFPDRNNTAKVMMEALDAQFQVYRAKSFCAPITSGHKFSMVGHPVDSHNRAYVAIAVEFTAEQNPDFFEDDEIETPYINNFQCIPHGGGSPVFRPLRKTPKPIVHGSQTAIVVGPSGEEIFTDKYGRVKVQFHWDRDGKYDSDSSCWLRVAQTWAGNKWGTMFIPRIGMEVVVSFLEGDPDQPIITGCVYNPETMPPYTLPDEKTKSTIKSDSSKGGGGFNEFRFEDKKGEEQIFIHAEKNKDIRVKNDCMELIKHDRHLIIENEQFEKVKKDKHLQVVGDHNEKVDGTMSLKVGVDLQEKVGSNYALDAGMAVHIKAGMTAVIEAGTSLTMKVGGNFININPGGVFISGTMVMINSGGAAGSGAGASPEAPKDPKEADTAEPGARVSTPPPPPPKTPRTYSVQAIALQQASVDGSPFCDI